MTNKPIPVRLLPDELQQLRELAQREQRSLASVYQPVSMMNNTAFQSAREMVGQADARA